MLGIGDRKLEIGNCHAADRIRRLRFEILNFQFSIPPPANHYGVPYPGASTPEAVRNQVPAMSASLCSLQRRVGRGPST